MQSEIVSSRELKAYQRCSSIWGVCVYVCAHVCAAVSSVDITEKTQALQVESLARGGTEEKRKIEITRLVLSLGLLAPGGTVGKNADRWAGGASISYPSLVAYPLLGIGRWLGEGSFFPSRKTSER